MSEEAPITPEAARMPAARIGLHEGSIGLPPGFEDRTTNLFVPGNPQLQPNLSVARDWMKPDETLQTYVDRQLSLLKSQLASHRLIGRETARLGEEDLTLAGERIESVHKNGKSVVYQRQAAFEVAPKRVLILTASSPRGFDDAFEQLWSDWLSSFLPPPAPMPPAPESGGEEASS